MTPQGMTVRELVERLQKSNQDLYVLVKHDGAFSQVYNVESGFHDAKEYVVIDLWS